LRAVIDQVEVDNGELRIHGRKSELIYNRAQIGRLKETGPIVMLSRIKAEKAVIILRSDAFLAVVRHRHAQWLP
jgi:hypothetical protein